MWVTQQVIRGLESLIINIKDKTAEKMHIFPEIHENAQALITNHTDKSNVRLNVKAGEFYLRTPLFLIR
jgi:hypothetical protein